MGLLSTEVYAFYNLMKWFVTIANLVTLCKPILSRRKCSFIVWTTCAVILKPLIGLLQTFSGNVAEWECEVKEEAQSFTPEQKLSCEGAITPIMMSVGVITFLYDIYMSWVLYHYWKSTDIKSMCTCITPYEEEVPQ